MLYYKTNLRVVFFLIFFNQISFAQNSNKFTLKGKVIDFYTSKPVNFANITVFNKTTDAVLKGTITNDKGAFNITLNTSKIYIKISYIGFETLIIKDFKVVDTIANLAVIKLKENVSTLDEIIMETKKTKLVNSFGKQILFVGSDISSSGNSALGILENFPSVIVNLQGNISIRGDSNIIIYMNGKPTNKEGKSLKHLPAELIEKIELITNPSAEYGSEGISGILNIVLKKEKNKGFNLTTNANLQGLLNPFNLKYGGSINSNYSFDKANIFFNSSFTSTNYENSENRFQKCITKDCNILTYNYIKFEDGVQQDYNMNFGFLGDVSPVSTFEIEASYLIWNIKKDGLEKNNFLFNTNETQDYKLRNFGASIKEEYEIMATYNTVWNSKDEITLQFRHRYDSWDKKFQNNLNNLELANTPIENSILTNKNIDIDNDFLLDGKITLKRNYGELIAGFSSQLRYNNLKQNIQYTSGQILPTNDFMANSLQNAIFGQLKNEIGYFKWQIGIRLEKLDQNFNQVVDNINMNKNYFNIFPSGILEYEISNKQNLTFSYSKRINYPRLSQLNPFNFFINPLNIKKGNLDLEESKSNNIEVAYSCLKNNSKWTNTIFANFANNLIRTQISTSKDGISYFEPINDGNSISTGYEVSLTANPFKWLKLIQQGTFYYLQFSTINTLFDNQFSGSLRFFQELKFKNDLKIQIKESYTTPTISPQRKELSQFYMDIILRKKINKRWSINFSLTDVFRTKRISYQNKTDNFIIDEDLKFQFQRINFSINYKLKE